MRAKGPHSRDVMSQPMLSPGGGRRWDSEDPRMEGGWISGGGMMASLLTMLKITHVLTPGCRSTVFSVSSQEPRGGYRGSTHSNCLLAIVLSTHPLRSITRCHLNWQERKVKLERRKKVLLGNLNLNLTISKLKRDYTCEKESLSQRK